MHDPAREDDHDRAILAAALRDVAGLPARAAIDGGDAPPAYELRRVVRRGGQGTVYEGVHRPTRRRVALKLLHDDGPDTAIERIRAERELVLLSDLDHPGIVPVRDSIEVRGRRWHVMDFVDGVSLDRFVAERRPNLEATLELLAEVAEAVNAAHLRGVIHRDLKPGNVLVDVEGRPHVLDFGLAKRVVGRTAGADTAPGTLTDTLTETGRFLGSVAWASPEQAEGRNRDVDLRADVHALGVMLHHALSGDFPYRVDGPLRETLEHIVRDEPVPLRRIRRDVDADIETIVLKCLQKDPARRYQSAGELAGDLRRRLAGKPIAARADSTAYLIGKLLRRHRGPVLVAGAFVAMLVGAAATFFVLYREAQTQTTIAAQASDVLDNGLIAAADPHTGRGPDAQIVDLVDEVARDLDARPTPPAPRLEATLRRTVGAAYLALTRLDESQRHLERALELFERERGPDAPETIRCLGDLAALRQAQGRFEEARTILVDAIGRARRAGAVGDVVVRLRGELGAAMERLGRFDESDAELQAVLGHLESASPPDADAIANARTRLATLWCERQQHAKALPLQRDALDHWIAARGDDHLATAVARQHLATTLVTRGRIDEAEAMLEQALTAQRRRLGESHADTLASLALLGIVVARQGDKERGLALLREAHGRSAEALGAEHNETLHAAHWLGAALAEAGRLDEAAECLVHVHELRRALPADNPHRFETATLLAGVHTARGELDACAEVQREIVEALDARSDRGGEFGLRARHGLATTLAAMDRAAEATSIFEGVVNDLAAAGRANTTTAGPSAPESMLVGTAEAARPVAHSAGDRAAAARMATAVADACAADGRNARLAAIWRLHAVDDFIESGRFAEARTTLVVAERDAAIADDPDVAAEWRRQRDRLRTAPIDQQVDRLRGILRGGG